MALEPKSVVGLKLAMGGDSYATFMSGQCFTEDEIQSLIESNAGNLELTAATMLEALADPELAGTFKLGDLAGDLSDTYKAWLNRADRLRARNGLVDGIEGTEASVYGAVSASITAWGIDGRPYAELSNGDV
jgi:hypothetical protein